MPLRPINQMRSVVQEWHTRTDRSHTVLDLMDRLLDEIERVKNSMPVMQECELVYRNPPAFAHLSIILQCDCNPNSTDFLVFDFKPNKRKDLWLDATVPKNRDYSNLNVLKQKHNNASGPHRILIKINHDQLTEYKTLIESHMRLALRHTKGEICP